MKDRTFALLSIAPALILVLTFTLYPIGYAIYWSLHRYRIGYPLRPFVGLENYYTIIASREFKFSCIATLYFVIVTVPTITLLALGIALILSQEFKGNIVLRTLLLIPWAMPSVSVAAIWNWIYDAEYGILNGILYMLGVIESYQAWKSSYFWALPIIVNVHIWKFTPIAAILLLAALSTVPRVLYEAAEIDGAGLLKRFRIITLPMIRPILMIVVFLQMVYALLWHFAWVFIITRGGPGWSTTTLPWYTYITAFETLDFGEGNALGVILALLVAMFFPIFLKRIRLREET